MLEEFIGFALGLVIFIIFFKSLSFFQYIRSSLEPYLGRILSNGAIGFFVFAITGIVGSMAGIVLGFTDIDPAGNFLGMVKDIAITSLVLGITGMILITIVAAITKNNF